MPDSTSQGTQSPGKYPACTSPPWKGRAVRAQIVCRCLVISLFSNSPCSRAFGGCVGQAGDDLCLLVAESSRQVSVEGFWPSVHV